MDPIHCTGTNNFKLKKGTFGENKNLEIEMKGNDRCTFLLGVLRSRPFLTAPPILVAAPQYESTNITFLYH